MDYEPNINDQRVKKRINAVLDWAAPFVIGKHGSVLPLHLSARGFTNSFGQKVPGLNDIFGPKGHALGDFLRAKLLVQVSRSYTPGEHSMSYRISRDGYEELATAYGDTSLPLDRIVAKHADELKTLTFQYKDQSNRLWHPLQNLPRAQKTVFWQEHGLPFDYDVVACAPSILFSLARKDGVPPILLETLQEYLDDRQGFRQHVAALTGLSHEDAKRLVNSLFNGAKLGANPYWSSFKLVDFNDEVMARLKADEQVTRLRRNIAVIWKRLELSKRLETPPTLDRVLDGVEQPDWKLKSSRDKWSVYFQHERAVLDAIKTHLLMSGVRHFTEHDGFRTDREVDLAALEAHVQKTTGIDLKIERKE